MFLILSLIISNLNYYLLFGMLLLFFGGIVLEISAERKSRPWPLPPPPGPSSCTTCFPPPSPVAAAFDAIRGGPFWTTPGGTAPSRQAGGCQEIHRGEGLPPGSPSPGPCRPGISGWANRRSTETAPGSPTSQPPGGPGRRRRSAFPVRETPGCRCSRRGLNPRRE